MLKQFTRADWTEIKQTMVGVADSDNDNTEIIDDETLEQIIKSEIKNHAYWPMLMKEKQARSRQVQVGSDSLRSVSSS